MGARQSGTTRTVSMENNSPIIDVSEAVAQRLKNGLKGNLYFLWLHYYAIFCLK